MRWFLNWAWRRKVLGPLPLEAELGSLSRVDKWRLLDAVTGMLILGATGSGKSSAAARYFLMRMIRAGFGGLVLTVKPEDLSDIMRYAAACGRTGDLVVIGPGQPHCCNLLQYELSHGGGPAVSRVENAVSLIQTGIEVAERDRHAGGGSGDNKYFERGAMQLLRSVLIALTLANEKVSLENIHRFIVSAPRTIEESRDLTWRESSFCYQVLCRADDQSKSASALKDYELSLVYLMQEYAAMDAKPRSSIVSTYTVMADQFQRGCLRDSFFSETTITPEASRFGKIIVLDYPTLRWNELGRISQSLFKFVWQRAMERCDPALKTRPVFLYSDEAQHFLTKFDGPFQATARSSRVATLYVTQNLPGMYQAAGGESGRYAIDSLLGSLQFKVLCAQDDAQTCEYQSALVGKHKHLFFNCNTQTSEQNFDFFRPGKNQSVGMSESLEYEIQPWEWARNFRTGGAENNCLVDAIIYQGGRTWQANGKTYLPVTFSQTEAY